MTTARQIITAALSLRLNRLSPGETLDPDVGALCLSALNDISDEWSGSSTLLWREILSPAVVSTVSATLGTSWMDIEPGQDILGATFNAGAGDIPMDSLTMQQYHENIRIKSLQGGLPRYWAYDGLATIYFYPIPTGQTITLRVHASAPNFADLDTDYVLPQGYKSAFADVLAERVARPLIGQVPPDVTAAARAAKQRIGSQVMEPAIIGGNSPAGNILGGWK